MNIQFFYPHWGSEHLGFDDFCQQVAGAGYSGIEMGVEPDGSFERIAREEADSKP